MTVNNKLSLERLLFWCGVAVFCVASIASGQDIYKNTSEYEVFARLLDSGNYSEAASLGDEMFKKLEGIYGDNSDFRGLKSKLTAAEFLADQMVKELKEATAKQMAKISNSLFETGSRKTNTVNKEEPFKVTPAKRYYETSLKLYSIPLKAEALKPEEKEYLRRYYNLKLTAFIDKIAKAGRALAVAEPEFKGTYDYTLVLPLLHVPGGSSLNIEVLPKGMRKPEEMDKLSDSCLLHYGLPFHSMAIAGEAAKFRNRSFSIVDFYETASSKCNKSNVSVAAECLDKAVESVPDNDIDRKVRLCFKSVQLWEDAKNYAFAATQARKIFETYPDHGQAGKAVWLYYHSLSRNNEVDLILAKIDNALNDRRCSEYKSKLLYIKWWALRRKPDQQARVAALEYEILNNYSDDPMIAPILLSQSTDMLAQQDYNGAYQSLKHLTEKFPGTNAAAQASKMLEKLRNTRGM